MNVSEQDGLEVLHAQTLEVKLLAKSFDGGSWARIDEHRGIAGAKKGRSDGARMASPVEVERDERIHRSREIVTQKGFVEPHSKTANRTGSLGICIGADFGAWS
jgi:hypothetical protein